MCARGDLRRMIRLLALSGRECLQRPTVAVVGVEVPGRAVGPLAETLRSS